MQDVKKLLERQIELMEGNKKLLESGVVEVVRLLKLQAAESKLVNARIDMVEGTMEKLLAGLDELGNTSKDLLKEFSK